MLKPYLLSATDDTGGIVGIDFATQAKVQTRTGVVSVTFPAGVTNHERNAIVAATDPDLMEPQSLPQQEPTTSDEPVTGSEEVVP